MNNHVHVRAFDLRKDSTGDSPVVPSPIGWERVAAGWVRAGDPPNAAFIGLSQILSTHGQELSCREIPSQP
jgi:hypothetical protein